MSLRRYVGYERLRNIVWRIIGGLSAAHVLAYVERFGEYWRLVNTPFPLSRSLSRSVVFFSTDPIPISFLSDWINLIGRAVETINGYH